jgi:hypothetical protein
MLTILLEEQEGAIAQAGGDFRRTARTIAGPGDFEMANKIREWKVLLKNAINTAALKLWSRSSEISLAIACLLSGQFHGPHKKAIVRGKRQNPP